jgi:hypothetical protein
MLSPQPMMEGIETETKFLAWEDLVFADLMPSTGFLEHCDEPADALAQKGVRPKQAEEKIVIKTLNTDQAIQIWFSTQGQDPRQRGAPYF